MSVSDSWQRTCIKTEKQAGKAKGQLYFYFPPPPHHDACHTPFFYFMPKTLFHNFTFSSFLPHDGSGLNCHCSDTCSLRLPFHLPPPTTKCRSCLRPASFLYHDSSAAGTPSGFHCLLPATCMPHLHCATMLLPLYSATYHLHCILLPRLKPIPTTWAALCLCSYLPFLHTYAIPTTTGPEPPHCILCLPVCHRTVLPTDLLVYILLHTLHCCMPLPCVSTVRFGSGILPCCGLFSSTTIAPFPFRLLYLYSSLYTYVSCRFTCFFLPFVMRWFVLNHYHTGAHTCYLDVFMVPLELFYRLVYKFLLLPPPAVACTPGFSTITCVFTIPYAFISFCHYSAPLRAFYSATTD